MKGIITNNKARPLLNSWDLPEEVLPEFDYYNNEGLTQAQFFQYKGDYYDLASFIRIESVELKNWDGILSTSAFSAILIKLDNSGESVIVGSYYP